MIYWIQEASTGSNAILSAGVIAAIVGLFGVIIGQFLTGRRHSRDLRQAEQGQITDRFSKAIDQLGSEKLAVRHGGIYALERIANDSPERDYSTIMEVLTTYVRENARWQPEDTPQKGVESNEEDEAFTEPEYQLLKPPADIQAILTVVGRRKKAGAEDDIELDLTETDLRGVRLINPKLQKADISGANLQEAIVNQANLQEANLLEANLQLAILDRANLQGAILGSANLQRAILAGANLQEASLRYANLQGALLQGANLQGADLYGTNLQEANLQKANLQGALLQKANLQGSGSLTQAQINAAYGDETTKLPDHLQRPAHWIKGEEEKSGET